MLDDAGCAIMGMRNVLDRLQGGEGQPLPLLNRQPLPHANVLDTLLNPMRLPLYLEFTALRPKLLVETVLLPHGLQVGLGVNHDEALPYDLLLFVVAQHLRQLECGRRRGPVDHIRVLCRGRC
jgi:hypothetical protein